ncbi:MAG: TlpA family protein disulfide reductase [Acidimicrobiia bacterium]
MSKATEPKSRSHEPQLRGGVLIAGMVGLVALAGLGIFLLRASRMDAVLSPTTAEAAASTGKVEPNPAEDLGAESATSGEPASQSAVAEGPPAPAVALLTFEGSTVNLSDFFGRGLVVNFWASDCPFCYAEMPGFEAVYQRHRETVEFLGINLGPDPYASEIIELTGVTYPLVRDLDGTAYRAFGGFTMPTTIFISGGGVIIEVFSGPLTEDWLEERVVDYFNA